MLPRERCDFSAAVDRPPLNLPGNNRIVIWTKVNYEVWDDYVDQFERVLRWNGKEILDWYRSANKAVPA